jgi:outer membrane protein OmpA-like peptidoglycan-associated protein
LFEEQEEKMNRFLSFGLTIFSIFLGITTCFAVEALQVTIPNRSARISHNVLENDMLVVSVTDEQGEPITGLGIRDFVVQKGEDTATLLSVETLETSAEVGLNLFLVLDNSDSMKLRNAINPLLSALEELLPIIRPIDMVQVVMFDPKGSYQVGDRILHIRTTQSSDVTELRRFFQQGYEDLSVRTYLYEAMLGAVDLAAAHPKNANKYMVVFSDGEDINSDFGTDVVRTEAKKVANLKIYAIDFMPTKEEDPFLKALSEQYGGSLWKAASSNQLVNIFKTFATTLQHQYVISYRFQPRASITVEPTAITIEEITTIDTSPLLSYIFFETGKSQIPERYMVFHSQTETQDFDETKLKTTMDKYVNVLNIIGKRLRENPEARVTIVGCNSGVGEEKGRTDLSRARAESVRLYLKYLWGVDYSRMDVEARDLPEVPTANRLPEGRAENQRVEIYSDTPSILGTVKSVYVDAVSDVETIRVRPQVLALHGLRNWKISLKGNEPIDSVSGMGSLEPVYNFSTKDMGLAKLLNSPQIEAEIAILDEQEQQYQALSAVPLAVTVLRKEQLLSKKLGYKVMEKYALILFDFDSAEIKGDNAAILETIVARTKALPGAFVRITGHTDSIGSETYNMDLSKRRAKSVYDEMIAAGIDSEGSIAHYGVGPHNPLYDNTLPEGRALNRTVTIDLEYEQRQ